MRPYAFWPTWWLVWIRNVLEWTCWMPEVLLAVYVELAHRERPGPEETEEVWPFWCPAAAGVA